VSITEPIIEGIALGLTLSVLIGPVFFTHIQTVIYKGFTAGNILSVGITASDIFLIFLCYIGTAQLIDNKVYKISIGLIGGLVLIGFGIYTFQKRIKFKDLRPNSNVINGSGIVKLLIQGFVLNFANPFVWFFWLGVVSLVNSNFGHNKFDVILFFSAVVGTYFIINIVKAILAYRIKRLIRPKTILIINRVVGVLLVVFGFILIGRIMYQEHIFHIRDFLH